MYRNVDVSGFDTLRYKLAGLGAIAQLLPNMVTPGVG